MPTKKPTLSDVSQQLTTFIAVHAESAKGMDAKLDGINDRLDKLNGKVAEHEKWINEQRGEKRGVKFVGGLVSAVLLIVGALISAAVGMLKP